METETAAVSVDLGQIYDPTRNDKQVLFHTARETYRLFGGAMGGGKTAAIINEGQELNLEIPGNFGLLLRKTWPSFKDTVMPQLEKFTPKELVYSWNLSSKIITYHNGSRLRYGGAGVGQDDWKKWMSGEYGWIALDQAEDFTEDEFVNLSTRLRLVRPGMRYVFMLTCNPNVGWIKERFIEDSLPDHIFIPSLPHDNRRNLPPDYVERMRKILSPKMIRAMIEGDWEAIGDPDNVFNYLAVQEAIAREVQPGPPYEFGIDVARSGADKTVIALREGFKASIVHTAQGHDTMRTAGHAWQQVERLAKRVPRAKDEAGKAQPVKISIKVDCDGLGAGVYDRLKEQKREKQAQHNLIIKLIEIHGAAKASNPVKYKNLRTELHFGLLELMEYIQLPRKKEIAAQLMAIKYENNSAGQVLVVPKDEIKKKLGRSPDEAEAVIYAFGQPPKAPQPRVRSLL